MYGVCSSHAFPDLQRPAALPAPVQPQLGEQWEEFVKYAQELQRQIAEGERAVSVVAA